MPRTAVPLLLHVTSSPDGELVFCDRRLCEGVSGKLPLEFWQYADAESVRLTEASTIKGKRQDAGSVAPNTTANLPAFVTVPRRRMDELLALQGWIKSGAGLMAIAGRLQSVRFFI